MLTQDDFEQIMKMLEPVKQELREGLVRVEHRLDHLERNQIADGDLLRGIATRLNDVRDYNSPLAL